METARQLKRCEFCGALFDQDPPDKPDLLKYVDACWTCSARIKRASEETKETRP